MNIYTVRDNLKKTISSKEMLLADYEKARKLATMVEDHALYTTVQFLKINIDELNRILADVEICCTQHNEMSWTINPERMGQ